MKKWILFFFVFAFAEKLEAQNLVPNPSFEEYINCPTSFAQIDSTMYWSSFGATPEYYNSCSMSAFADVPQNYCGFQVPSSGDAYIGLVTYAGWLENFREFVGVQLIQPLQVGVEYFISVKVVSADSSTEVGLFANNVGLKFTTAQFNFLNPLPISNSCQINSTSVLMDSINWVVINGSFLADSAYQFLAIGNFFDDANTDTVWMGLSTTFWSETSYIFVDDVCVSAEPAECDIKTGINMLSNVNDIHLFPNPATSTLHITIPTSQLIQQAIVYNAEGKVVRSFVHCSPALGGASYQNAFDADVSELMDGLYFIKVLTGDSEYRAKFLKF